MERHWFAVFAPVAATVLLSDQLAKFLATRQGIVLHNPAYALGVVGGPAPALIFGTVAVMLAFFVLLVPRAVAFGVSPAIPALIAGGMLGNLVDRVLFGAARDFLTTPWAIINFADISVAVGIVAFVGALLAHGARQTNPSSTARLH